MARRAAPTFLSEYSDLGGHTARGADLRRHGHEHRRFRLTPRERFLGTARRRSLPPDGNMGCHGCSDLPPLINRARPGLMTKNLVWVNYM